MSIGIHPILTNTLLLPLLVTGIGTQLEQCSIVREVGYPNHQIIFSMKGSGKLITEAGEFIIGEGEYFYLEPNKYHKYEKIGDLWSTNWILFKCPYKDMLDSLSYNKDRIGTFNLVKDKSIFYDMVSNLKNGSDYDMQMVSSQMYQLLIQLNHNDNTSLNKQNIRLNPIIEYIDEHYMLDLSLKHLSDLIGITEHYFCKLFKDTYKMRPFEYITKKRIQAAKILLLESNMSIKELALKVGYHDNSYFGAVFKKHETMSPSVYRG